MQLESLTKREIRILKELMGGERVASVADKLSISKHTVRNHLRGIFSKLGVHSQAELIAYVKKTPGALGGEGQAISDSELELSHIAARTAEADTRVACLIAEILLQGVSVAGLKKVLSAALPLDQQSEGEWRDRISLWGREISHPEILHPHIERITERRKQVTKQIAQAQADGIFCSDQGAEEIVKGLYSVMLGAGLQILREPNETSRQQQLLVVEAYVDSIAGSV